MTAPREFPDTRPSLLAALQNPDGSSTWDEFFHRYAPAVYRVARLRGLPAHDADDIVQQVMLAIVRHIGDFDYDRDRGLFRQWVRRIAENKIRDLWRRPSLPKTDAGGPALDECPDGGPTIDDVWEQEWRLQDLLYCLDRIASDTTPRRMEAFRLYVLEGVSACETAERVGMKTGDVYVARTQIINKVRAMMRRLTGDS